MSRQYASQLLFEVIPSVAYQYIVMSLAMLAGMAILLISIASYVHFVLFALLVFLVMHSAKNNIYRELQWRPDGSWTISQHNFVQSATLQSGSVATPFFTSLYFKLENKKSLTVILFKDNIDEDKFRQLRVRLKVEGIKKPIDISHLTDD